MSIKENIKGIFSQIYNNIIHILKNIKIMETILHKYIHLFLCIFLIFSYIFLYYNNIIYKKIKFKKILIIVIKVKNNREK